MYIHMHGTLRVLTKEHVVSIRDLQKSPSTHLKTITRIMKGSATLGFFFPLKEIERLFGANRVGSIWNGGASEEEYKEAYRRGDIIDD